MGTAEQSGMARALIGQFGKVWQTLKRMVEDCPDEQWLVGECPQLIPVRQAYHILAAAEWCCEVDRFAETNAFGLKRSTEVFGAGLPNTEWPDRGAMLAMIRGIEERIEARFRRVTDEAMVSPLAGSGRTVLEDTIYMLRHCQQHLGEMKAEYRRRELGLPEWR
jgi:hypothetical protein